MNDEIAMMELRGGGPTVLFALRLRDSGRTWYVTRQYARDGIDTLDGFEPRRCHHRADDGTFSLPCSFFEEAAEASDDVLERDDSCAGMHLSDVPDGLD